MDAYLTLQSIEVLVPEIIVVATAALVLVGGAFSSTRDLWNLVSVVGLGLAGAALVWQQMSPGLGPHLREAEQAAAFGPLIVDVLAHALRWLVLVSGILFVLVASRSAEERLATDYLGSILLVIAGMMLVCVAGDLILLVLGLELISIPTYILLYLGRRDAASQEAAAKYFYLSVLSSAILLYGLSFLYGVAGSIELTEIRAQLPSINRSTVPQISDQLRPLLPVGVLLIVGGLGFKIAAVPFHFYAPDVYQGTTNGNAGLLSVAPKIAGMVALVRIATAIGPSIESIGWQTIAVLAIVTMTLGNVLALWQTNIRRMLAYSSIAHAGYMLIGITVGMAAAERGPTDGSLYGYGATLFYLLTYSLVTIGTFAALAYLGRKEKEIDTVDDLAGLGRSYPLIAFVVAAFMFSLTGIPPMPGFWGKLALFITTLDMVRIAGDDRVWFVVLALAGALNAAISAGYYLKVVGAIYFRKPINVPRGEGGLGARLAVYGAAALTAVVAIFPGVFLQTARNAGQSAAFVQQQANQPGDVAPPVASDTSTVRK